MVPLLDLWLPIILSAVFVFIASSVMHMVLKYHHSDYRRLPDEEKVAEVMRAAGVTPGFYTFPHCEHKDMGKPETIEKQKRGPCGMLTIIPSGPPNMGIYLGKWFAFLLLVSLFAAYLASRTLAPGTHYLQVFRVVGTAAFLAYGVAQFQSHIWRGQTVSMTIKDVIDGLVYALLTAGTFGWLWPKA